MFRQIISIDESKCTGCGICLAVCHEGAIDIVDGKAKLARENFCDGFGHCLAECPSNAISIKQREALSFDEVSVMWAQLLQEADFLNVRDRQISRTDLNDKYAAKYSDNSNDVVNVISRLKLWPCQIKLTPDVADFYNGSKLLIAASCTAYAYTNIHEDFMKDKVTLIYCPKIDSIDYSEKMSRIIKNNDIKSILVLRMDVPCCDALENSFRNAVKLSGKDIAYEIKVVNKDGKILD